MTANQSRSMKAMLLLVVFLLNTVTGFACAVGMDMGFNSDHHAPVTVAKVAVHEHGQVHQHKDGSKHVHAGQDHHQKKDQHKSGEKENCCKDAVAKLTASDKLTQRSFDLSQLSLPFVVLAGIHYPLYQVISIPVNVPNGYFSRHCRSPITDVRIAIQSFQI